MQADDGLSPTPPRLGRSDTKRKRKGAPKVGVFVKRTYAGVNKQTSKLASSFRKDVPGGDPEFEQQREEFEQLLGKVTRLEKRVRRYNKTFSDMGSNMLDLAEVLQSFGETAEDKRFGEDFMKAAVSIDSAAASFSTGVSQIDHDLKAFSAQLKQYSKQVELRDSALAELNKITRKAQKAKKRPEAIKSQQTESRYEEVKQVYVFLNDEVKQQLQIYNSQRMLYIMPQLEKLSACHVNFLQQALSGSENLSPHRPLGSNGSRKGSKIEERPPLPRSKTEGHGLRASARPLYARRQSNPELREVEPLIYREVEDEADGEEPEEPELGTSPPFGSLASPSTLRSVTFSQSKTREEVKRKKNKQSSRSKGKKNDPKVGDEKPKATEDRNKRNKNKKQKQERELGKEKRSSTGNEASEDRKADHKSGLMVAEAVATARSQSTLERKPSFRRPANLHPPSRPTPPTPEASQLSDVTTPSCSLTTSSSASSLSSLSSSSLASEDQQPSSQDEGSTSSADLPSSQMKSGGNSTSIFMSDN